MAVLVAEIAQSIYQRFFGKTGDRYKLTFSAVSILGLHSWYNRQARTPRRQSLGALVLVVAALTPMSGCIDLSSGDSEPEVVEQSSEPADSYSMNAQSALLKGGYMKTNRGKDVDFDAETLSRNFRTVAFNNEFEIRAGFFRLPRTNTTLRRWTKPVRIKVHFGDAVAISQQQDDLKTISDYVSRLSHLTGHKIVLADRDPNILLLVLEESERKQAQATIREFTRFSDPDLLRWIADAPAREICFVHLYGSSNRKKGFDRAVIVVKAEVPDLLRMSCYHEEIAQGLGLPNDGNEVKPSIFNDDEEYALLTYHDELLLRMLYDPRLEVGMSWSEAEPTVNQLTKELKPR